MIALIVTVAGAWCAALPAAVNAQQETAGAELDARLAQLHRAGDYEQAVALIRPLLERDPENHGLLCDIADNLTDWARITEDEDEQEARYEEAVEYARRAVATDSSSAQGWFQFGKAYGRLALFKGGKTKVNMSKEVKQAFEMAIELDPRHAGSLHGLARWHREVANLSWLLKTAAKIIYGGLPPASNEEAVRLFEQAIEIEPETISHHLELGKTWLEMKEKEKARAEFELVLSLPEDDAEDPDWKTEAEELLKKTR
jgi:tetratricopeptide (TPR) repeat protein